MNRYGRHGSNAWLRWHKKSRQKQRVISLAVKKPFIPVIVINTSVPMQHVGRIIVIVIGTPNGFDETNIQGIQEYVDSNQLALQNTDENPKLTPENQEIINSAQYSASNWVDDIQQIYGSTYVKINKDKLKLLAKKETREIVKRNLPLKSREEIDKLVDIYIDAFLMEFAEKIEEIENIGPILSSQDWEIQKIAVKDKDAAPARYMRHYHQRDLGVIQAIRHLDINLDEAPDHLEEIHVWADKYDKIYSNPRKGVEWPAAETFRDRQG